MTVLVSPCVFNTRVIVNTSSSPQFIVQKAVSKIATTSKIKEPSAKYQFPVMDKYHHVAICDLKYELNISNA